MITFNTLAISFSLSKKNMIKKWLKNVAESEGKKIGELAFIFCSDEEVLQINYQYLNHDYYTDVITFDYTNGYVISGDVFISIDTVRANADIYRQSFVDELNRVMLHGVLHLCGYNDNSKQKQKQMRMKEDFYLTKIPKI